MEIGLYEEWMKPQVARLFSIQYGVSEEEFTQLMSSFYEDTYQANRCILITAKEGETVIGFQSFFYWPYQQNDKTFNSFQSGNSLVHPDYRGKGIFQKLLDYVENHRKELGIDLLIGFPIDASIGSLIRNKWVNVLNIKWRIRIINLLSIFRPLNHSELLKMFPDKELFLNKPSTEFVQIENSLEFNKWRKKLYPANRYYSFYYSEGDNEILFKLKLNIRKKMIKELIIGNLITNTYSNDFITNALNDLVSKAKSTGMVTLLSIAINEDAQNSLSDCLKATGFKKIRKEIYFCIKTFNRNEFLSEKKNWVLYRGDIDTW
ncbi:MAG: GNAT family N-acetyltransferase [Bacteroidota bacterium]|nr:GNAT family N-acetyltransferase [Bacteroidota bacterium]